jgi:endonuclease YncB( thermonuclease family)
MGKMSSVIDGNTIVVTLRGQQVKVRMHGIVVPPGDEQRPILQLLNSESKAFLKKYLSDGWIYLEYPDGAPKPDADGIVPAFVYRGADAAFLNKKLVAEGLAIVNRKEPNKFSEDLSKSQTNARGAQRGIWGSSFRAGDGEKIAAGIAQSTYIGEPGANMKNYSNTTYVHYWIILY